MKIVATSDTHGQLGKVKLPPGDVLVVAGDILRNFTLDRHIDSQIQLKHLKCDFVPWLIMCRKIYSTILVIPGNHDRCFEHLENECRRLVEEVDRTFLLIDRTIDIDGVKFYGSPWTPWFYGDVWSFNIPEKEGAAKAIWEKIPADTDVVITHGPPYGIRDYCDRHAGCSVLGSRILEIKPRAHIFGHIHEGAGQSLIDSTLYVNAAFMDKGSGPQVSEVTK